MVDAHLGQHFQAVDVGHDEIKQDQRDLVAFGAADEIERRAAAGGGDHGHAGTADGGFQQAPLHRIVIDDENSLGHHVLLRGDPMCSCDGKGLFKMCPFAAQIAP